VRVVGCDAEAPGGTGEVYWGGTGEVYWGGTGEVLVFIV